MASIHLLPSGKWRAQVRQKGYQTISKNFRLKGDAEAWSREQEARIEGGASYFHNRLRSTTVSDIVERFMRDVVPHRKGKRWEENRCYSFQRETWSKLNLTEDIQGPLMDWCDARLAGANGRKVTAATVNRDLNMLSSVFTHAINRLQLDIPGGNPVRRVPRPKVRGGERDVVWTDHDLEVLLDHLGFNMAVAPTTVRSYLGWVLMIARLTGLRLSNVVGIRIQDIDLDRRCIHFDRDVVKNDENYDCPLSTEAVSVVGQLLKFRAGQKRLFVSNVTSIGTMLRSEHREAAKKHPQLLGLRTHDLRHTWTTEMAAKVPNHLTMLKISGRRTVKSLARYYHPAVEDLAKLLG